MRPFKNPTSNKGSKRLSSKRSTALSRALDKECLWFSLIRVISIIAYGITLAVIAGLEFADSSWTLYLHAVKTVSAAGIFNYSLTPSVVMHYNLTELPEYVTFDGTTIGEPIGIFSPVLVSCIALGLAIIGHLFFIVTFPCGKKWLSKSVMESISALFINITKLILVVLVFMVSGMRDVSSIMLICAVQVSILFMYFVLLHTNDPGDDSDSPNGYESVSNTTDSNSASNGEASDEEQLLDAKRSPMEQQKEDGNLVMRIALGLALAFQYTALAVTISGNYVQMSMIYVTAVFLFVNDLLYFLLMAVVVPNDIDCGCGFTSYKAKTNLVILFDWLINVPIPFFIYFTLHNQVAE